MSLIELLSLFRRIKYYDARNVKYSIDVKSIYRHGGNMGIFRCVCVGGGGGGEGDRFFKWIRGHACPENFKTKFSSLLIRFIMAIGGKYKTS